MIEVKKFIFGAFAENTYVAFDAESHEAVIIDPGNMNDEEDKILFDFLEEKKLQPKYIVATHSHIDHIIGVGAVKKKFNCPFLAPEKDMPLLMNAGEQGRMFGLEVPEIPYPDEFLSEETKIKINNFKGEFIFTPGHSPGEHCLYFKENNILFSGDVLFKETIGRTDLWGGNYNQLIRSIKEKLFLLPDEVVVYPGHNEETTIGSEKKNNPFF